MNWLKVEFFQRNYSTVQYFLYERACSKRKKPHYVVYYIPSVQRLIYLSGSIQFHWTVQA
jgi:hypothetical protein